MSFLRRLFARPPRTLASVDAYRLWSASYPAEAHNKLMQTEQDAMLALLPELRGKIVLDLACGTGRYARIAESRGAKNVIALDNSIDMLRVGKLSHPALATMNALPLRNHSVDVVLCGLALGHLTEIAAPLREIGRILTPGGIALISDFHPFQALNGAKRTFHAPDGSVFAVEHYAHLYSDYLASATAAGLIIDRVSEPRLAEAGHQPVVLVLRLQK